jgi:hypothetical protein
MTPTITIPDYAIEAGAKANVPVNAWSDLEPRVQTVYLNFSRDAIIAALAEMVKRGDAHFISAKPAFSDLPAIGPRLIITLHEPKA